MKYTRVYYLNFPSNTSVASAYINIPNVVKTIHCKSMAYQVANVPAAGTAQYITVVSSLTQNQPLGIVFEDSTYPINTGNDIEYESSNPQPVQGYYTFTLKAPDGSDFLPSGSDYLVVILEFNTPDELF